MNLIYVSKDGKSAFYKCPTEHGKRNPVYMVEREVRVNGKKEITV
jgi:hypothetical protein